MTWASLWWRLGVLWRAHRRRARNARERTFGVKPDVCPPCPKCGERVSDVHFIASRTIPEGRTPDARICRACGWTSGAGGT